MRTIDGHKIHHGAQRVWEVRWAWINMELSVAEPALVRAYYAPAGTRLWYDWSMCKKECDRLNAQNVKSTV